MRLYHLLLYISVSCNGCQGYRSNGTLADGLYGGTCGTGSPYYLLCGECRNHYTVEGSTASLHPGREASDRDAPYAHFLHVAPDLLGTIDTVSEHGWLSRWIHAKQTTRCPGENGILDFVLRLLIFDWLVYGSADPLF